MKKSTLKIIGKSVLALSFLMLWTLVWVLILGSPRKSDELKLWERAQEVVVDEYIEGEWMFLNTIFIDYGIDIDYDKIKSINSTNLNLMEMSGFYNPVSERIYIDNSIKEREDILIVLAHEVAHSQGAVHDYSNPIMAICPLCYTEDLGIDMITYYIIYTFLSIE